MTTDAGRPQRACREGDCWRVGVQQTWSEGAAAAEAGAAAAAVEEMAVTKEGMACASSSLGLHAPGPIPYLKYIAKQVFTGKFLCRSMTVAIKMATAGQF